MSENSKLIDDLYAAFLGLPYPPESQPTPALKADAIKNLPAAKRRLEGALEAIIDARITKALAERKA